MGHTFQDFFELAPPHRGEFLLQRIKESHSYHFTRNSAYRRSVDAKGVGEELEYRNLVHVLRPTAQVFKSYIDILGTPFPNHAPREFVAWMEDHLSIELPERRLEHLKPRYATSEDLLSDIETLYSDLGIEIGTSSGTSGRATIIMHDNHSATKAAEAYQLAVYRLWGTVNEHHFIFVMPKETRIVMAKVARTATGRLGIASQSHFTIPYSASPDQVRIRTGRLFESGFRGWREQYILNPFMNWMNENYVKSKYVNQTIALLEQKAAERGNTLLFGGWIQLHHVYEGLRERGYGSNGKTLILGPKSLIGTGGGMKESYLHTPTEIQDNLQSVLSVESGGPIPHRDVYGMAEANWAAAQCDEGNYHLPPWVYAVIINDEDSIVEETEATGLLAFYDPLTEAGLYPHFFKSTDRVCLINGGGWYDSVRACPCGYETAFIRKESIMRQDRVDEAGCAGQL